ARAPTVERALAAANASNSQHYDLVPYASNPFPLTRPASLAGVARLFGLDAPPIATARVLELGCASGGNLIPLAARFPQARFVGIDLSRQQVAEGRARIERLDLANIELQCRDLTEVDANDGAFDYIICHGVYSWVPYEVRQAILRIASQRLAPDGIAYISYNVLPGWRLRQGIRDSMLLYTGLEESPTLRISRARWLLNMMKEHAIGDTLYGRLWRVEAERLEQLSDGHLSHEFIEDMNEAFSFSEFMADARRNGLFYLAEAELLSMAPENFGSDVGQIIREMSGDLLFPMEQNIDIVTGRPFRQTLLVHEQRRSAISRNLDPSRLQGLHLVAPLGLSGVDDPDRPGAWIFSDSAGSGQLTTTSVAAAHAIQRVIERLPASITVNELVEPLASKSGDDATLDALFKMMV
ncbi:MAG: methyltransferase domain-containing protein, partial [Methylocystis sp.]|nr:methyltransferase domain-containing protein [Methylocystis sp.]